MLRVLADENFNHAIIRSLQRALPMLDIVTVQQIGLAGQKDPDVIEWAAQHNRVIITHDVQSMRGHIESCLQAGHRVAGVIAVPSLLPLGRAVYELRLIIECSEQEEWEGQMVYVPL